jgi:hypothetical protein
MGYVEKVMGDNERAVYRTHLHAIVLFERIIASLFVFAVFVGVSVAVLLPPEGDSGDRIRFAVGLITLGSLIMPLYLIVSAWIRGLRGREFAWSIWRAALAGILILSISLILMLFPGVRLVGWIAVIIAVIPLLEIVRILADWLNERYIITNRRVMEVRGIINKHVRDSALEKVNDVDLTQSVLGRMLGYGTVQIITGSDIGINMFRRISNPVRFKREMLNAKEQLHSTRPLTDIQVSTTTDTPVPATDAEIPDLIAELDELRQQGILTEEEFQAKKKELLERL